MRANEQENRTIGPSGSSCLGYRYGFNFDGEDSTYYRSNIYTCYNTYACVWLVLQYTCILTEDVFSACVL